MSIDVGELTSLTQDAIFQTYSLHQVQQISQSLTTKSNEKHEELRQLVASKYRDLLSTADEIIDMNKIAKLQDKKLYDLCFLKSGTLLKNSKIERNVEKWLTENVQGTNEDIETVVEEKRNRVINNSGFFLELSEVLNLSNDDSWEKIVGVLKSVKLDESWFQSRKKILNEKFKELEIILINKVNILKNTDELYDIDEFFVKNHQKFGFDISGFEKGLSNRLLELIDIENLRAVLKKFKKFQQVFLSVYNDDIGLKIDELEKLITKINAPGYQTEKELKLYELKVENDVEYLQNIEFLNNGLVYKDYQVIDTLVKQSFQNLRILEKIDIKIYNERSKTLKSIIETFKLHSVEKQNKPLLKYLNQLC